MNFVPMREVVSFAIGGGWGSETEVDGSVLTRVIRGADFPEAAEQNLSNAPLRWEKESKVNTRSLLAGDIVLEVSGGTKGRPTGRTVLVTQKMVDESVSPLIPASFCRKVQITREVAASKFVYYWLQLMHKSGRAWRYQNQSTGIANFQFEQFLDSEFLWLPSLKTQQAIAAFLGSLDDKIAANHRVIRTSIELAESLVSRSLTMGSTRLSDVAKVTMGTSPKGEFLSEEVTGLPFYQGVRDFGEITPQQRIYTDNPVREAEAGDILFAVRAPVGEVNIASERTAIGRGLAAIRGVKNHNALFYLLRSRPEIWNTHQDSGTVFSSINKADLANAPIPEVEMNSTDATLLDELHREALSLTSQNITLAKTRDELLPLLMSGKITVREAGQEVAAAGAQIPSEENEV